MEIAVLSMVRIASLAGYITVADRLGLDYHTLLKQLGLKPSLLKSPDRLISVTAAVRLLEKSAASSNCATFGLQMAMERKLEDLGMMSVLIALQPSLASLFDCIDRYRNLIVPNMAIKVERHEELAIVGIDLTLDTAEPHRQANDLLMAAAVITARSIFKDDWKPLCAHFSYPEPAATDLPLYRRIFGDELEFNAGFFGLTIARRDLEREHDHLASLAHQAEELVIMAMRPPEPNFTESVKHALIHLFPSSDATLTDVAAAMGINARTLQRRLEEEGHTFRELVSQARMQLARRLLSNRSVRIADIAEALGYSSTGAFSRWYAREFGEPPTQQRDYRVQ